MKTKTTAGVVQNCLKCAEEIKKADRSRKYAHELKNIFITISTVVNSEIESPHQYSSVSNNTSMVVESGDASPFIMEGRRQRNQSKTNSSVNININNIDSPFFFLKTLCDYGKTLIKEINEMGKEYTENGNNQVEPFNISKAIDFCVDMFDTKRKYDKSKKNLEFSSDINFSYDKMIKSISETGFKMVLINLLTNAYKFTIKGKIIVRAVSMPKERKIRILVKDSGKGFNPNDLTKNGCFYVNSKNQELNVDGSGLGLTIVFEILEKFNIKLDMISNPDKGGSLFYFDLEDTYPYYDEINPQSLMTESLTQIIKDINLGKKDSEYFHNNKKPQNSDFKINLLNMAKNQNKNIEDSSENEKSNNASISNKNINSNLNSNNLTINFNANNKQRFSFMGEVNCSPTFFNNSSSNEEKAAINNFQNTLQKNHINAYNNNKTNHSITFDKDTIKRRKSSAKVIDTYLNANTFNSNLNSYINNNNNFNTPNKKRIDRFYSLQKQISISSNIKKEGKPNILEQILEVNNHKNFQKLKTFNEIGKKEKNNKVYNGKNFLKKNINFDDIGNTLIENENILTKSELEKIKEIKDSKKRNSNKNYRHLLNSNYNKTKFYIFELRKIFLKNEIYFNLSKNQRKKFLTEPSSRNNSEKNNLKQKKSYNRPPNEVYIIICDDEPFVAMSAKELITKYYIKKGKKPKIYFTQDGFECIYLTYKLSIIENKKVEYILMDLEMPYLNGIVTCNFIKNIKEIKIPIFILSGDEPKDCEADGYCNKPLNEIDIINKLDKEK